MAVQAVGDREVTREEVVELADAVAASSGIASGIGSTAYGATLLVDAATADEAAELAVAELRRAAARAGLPPWPASVVEIAGEDDG